jgi:DNA-binding protein HU-beta
MNNKELISNISAKMQLPKKEVEEMLDATVSVFVSELADGKTIGIHGFGQLEVKKREERISVHPATQVRTLIPPKLVVNFKQSNTLKDKINALTDHE